eukprot:Skav201228  [mRNA]  locus=scaffold651:723872:729426:- [translate_table: standard]
MDCPRWTSRLLSLLQHQAMKHQWPWQPMAAQAVVIGSGIGGLYLAGLLAKSGRKLLELVSADPIEFAKHLGSSGQGWQGSEADGFVYDQIKIGDEPIHSLRAGRQNFIEDWGNYVAAHLTGTRIHVVKDVMDELFQSELLKAILCGQFGDYGMTLGQHRQRAAVGNGNGRPSSASFFIHAGIVSHYLEAWRLTGGHADFMGDPGPGEAAAVEAAGAAAGRHQSHVARYAFIGLTGSKEELQLTAANLWALPSQEIEKEI